MEITAQWVGETVICTFVTLCFSIPVYLWFKTGTYNSLPHTVHECMSPVCPKQLLQSLEIQVKEIKMVPVKMVMVFVSIKMYLFKCAQSKTKNERNKRLKFSPVLYAAGLCSPEFSLSGCAKPPTVSGYGCGLGQSLTICAKKMIYVQYVP